MRSRFDTLARRLALLALAALALTACAGASSTRVDPAADDELGGTLIDSADVIASTDQAAAALIVVLLTSEKSGITLAAATIKNESVQPINTGMLTDRMIDKVVNGARPRVTCLARSDIDDILREREGKREGVYSSSGEKALLGADYLLTGTITSLSKRYEGDRADYFQLSFRLVDAESSAIVWSDQFAFKKVGDAGVIYQ